MSSKYQHRKIEPEYEQKNTQTINNDNKNILNNDLNYMGNKESYNIQLSDIYYLFEYITESVILFSKSNDRNFYISIFILIILIIINIFFIKKIHLF